MHIELFLEFDSPRDATQRHFVMKCGAKTVFEGYEHQLSREQKSICQDILEAHSASICAIAKSLGQQTEK